MRKYCKFYTSVKSGITMSFKGWLQLISQKEFGRELCMTAPTPFYKEFQNGKITTAEILRSRMHA